jgi:hypothetical protein
MKLYIHSIRRRLLHSLEACEERFGGLIVGKLTFASLRFANQPVKKAPPWRGYARIPMAKR